MTKRRNTAGRLVFSLKKLIDLKKNADPLTRDLLTVWNKHGWAHDLVAKAAEIEAAVFIPEPKTKPGPKSVWEKNGKQTGNALYAWLEIEIRHRAARIKNPQVEDLAPFLRKMFRGGGQKKICVLEVVGDPAATERFVIESAGRARRLHSAGAKILEDNRYLREKWDRLADSGAKSMAGSNLRGIARTK